MNKIRLNTFKLLNEYVANIFKGLTNKNFVIINFNDKKNIEHFINYQKNNRIKITNLSEVENSDCLVKNYDLVNFIEKNNSNLIIYGVSTHLKLQGKSTLLSFLVNLAENRNFKINSKIIFIMYDLEAELNEIENKFLRSRENIAYYDDSRCEGSQNLFFITNDETINSDNIIEELKNIGDLEVLDGDVYCKTNNLSYIDRTKSMINYKIYEYDCYKEFYDKFACSIEKKFINTEKIKHICKKYTKEKFDEFRQSVLPLIRKGTPLSEYEDYNELEKYLFLIIAQDYIITSKEKSYFNIALNGIYDTDKLEQVLYNKISEFDPNSDYFSDYYNERYKMFKSLDKEKTEILSQKYVANCLYDKQDKLVYYLSDLTRLECDKIIEYITENKTNVYNNKILNILKTNYNDLYSYLQNNNQYKIFGISEEYIKNYIEMYKKQKVSNTIDDKFISIVEEQAEKHDFLNVEHRKRILSKLNIDMDRDFIVFFDALGIEYLNFIIDLCNAKDVYCDAYIGRCNLPSETEFNKDFLDLAKNIKFSDIDDLVHEQCVDTVYEKLKAPIYINQQLSCIKSKVNTIINKFLSQYNNIYIVADHGATRLAKIYDKKKDYSCKVKGVAGGRFVEYDDDLCNNSKIRREIKDNKEYAVITNYDRFVGGRIIGNEVHGGATLEEVLVPIIRLSFNENNKNNFKVAKNLIQLKVNQDLIITVYGKYKLKNVSFKFETNFNEYDGNIEDLKEANGSFVYTINFGNLKNKETGKFKLIIYDKNDIYDSIKMEIVRAGVSKTNEF